MASIGLPPGRYLLGVVDDEIQLLQIAARTPAGQSARRDTAYAALLDGLNAELADWIAAWAPTLTQQDRTVLAALGVNGLLGATRRDQPLPPIRHASPMTTTSANGPPCSRHES
jgi:hypothetical protein